MSKPTSVILHNRLSPEPTPDEKDVLEQVNLVKSALEALNYSVTTLDFNLNLKKTATELKKIKPDFVFNLVESVNNDGRLIHLGTSLLEHLGIPYTGCPNEAVFMTSNKLLAKKLLKANNIATPEDEYTTPFKPGRYIIKSVWEHASVGLDEGNTILAEFSGQIKTPHGFFAERYIDGREFNISILNGKVLPCAEIDFSAFSEDKLKIVGYRAKWDQDSFEYHNTNRKFDFNESDTALLQNLREITEKCWQVFDLKGYARVDFRVDTENNPYVLEINSNPCISGDSGFVAAAQKAGLGFQDIVENIVSNLNSFIF